MVSSVRRVIQRAPGVGWWAAVVALLTFFVASCGNGVAPPEQELTGRVASVARGASPTLTPQSSGTAVRLVSISVVNERVVWVCGRNGTVLRTLDGGSTWEARNVPGAESLSLVNIRAFSKDLAFVLTNNGGPNARIYRTEDGGQTWTLHFQSPISNTFYDCFGFWSPTRAFAVPDAENGRFDVVRMTDGVTWENIGDLFPAGQPGEGFFPTSGTCIATRGSQRAWAASGGGAQPRVIVTEDGGDSWSSYPTPIGGTATSGGMTIHFRDNRHGILGGGNVVLPAVQQPNFARTGDGGRSWQLATPAPFPGPLYGLAYARHDPDEAEEDDQGDQDEGDSGGGHGRILATGPGGTAWSADEGDTWEAFPSTAGLLGVAFANHHTGWLVGLSGRIMRIDF